MFGGTDLYEILGVSPNADPHQLKIAFQTKARETHPDKNRNDPKATENFQKLNEAYLILKDKEKRQLYDQINSIKLPKFDQNNFQNFDQFFFAPKSKTKTKTIEKTVFVTLEDFYKGGEILLNYKRLIICPDCFGKCPTICQACGGTGRCSYFGRMVTNCHLCHGEGFSKDRCGGKKYITTNSTIEIRIDPGMEDGDRITFQNASDESLEYTTGDLIVTLKMKENKKFTRKNNDLFYTKKITLSQAILGSKLLIEHLDGRKLVLSNTQNKIINNGELIIIENEGMPSRSDRFKKGNLIVKFEIEFPEKIDENFRKVILKDFPPINHCCGIDIDNENTYFVIAEDEKSPKNEKNPKIDECRFHNSDFPNSKSNFCKFFKEKLNENDSNDNRYQNGEKDNKPKETNSYCNPM
ncbi:DnaJ protein ANJ1 [Tritrichomonas foetus]|uniref:DnaJ protein ANJ1 n=1 Tax=Tritrichomonas foetus TaxID=1144522 RepID=A0A1J4K634_9EUKA|nr:DnaJ protein ANJ1 [Tritrichomonas foetus]|eukprot:OHT06879.1 DnaJ protein ANJ1 [Tritrichomonas foetus]